MKKITITIFTILILTLTACGSASSTPQAGPATSSGSLPIETQLIIGTFKLEGTDQDVTAEQAAELLPLWQTLQVLYNSDTAAQEEINALTEQIQETMTVDQIQAITAMNLTGQDVFAIMRERGTGLSQSGNSSDSSTSTQSGGGFDPPDGGFVPGGGPPGEGGGFGGQGQGLSQEQIATAQASRQESSVNFAPTMLVNALIEFLQEKAGS